MRGARAAGEGPGEERDATAAALTWSILAHLRRNFLPYGLVTAIAVSVLAPGLGCAVHSLRVHKLSAPGIFLLSGLSLRLEDVRKAVRSPAPLLLGVGLISLALPWSAQVALRWLVQSGHPFVTASGLTNYDAEDLDIFSWTLSEADMQTLDAV